MGDINKETEQKMKGAINSLLKDFDSLRTGRANIAILDSIRIDYYGTPTALTHVANLGTPDSRTLTIQPWEKDMLQAIEKAILVGNLGLTPNNDGETIRISIPMMTEERRKEIAKIAKKYAEDSKVAVRNIRRDANEKYNRQKKEKEISEDDCKRKHDDIQGLTDSYVSSIDKKLHLKEKEIMEA